MLYRVSYGPLLLIFFYRDIQIKSRLELYCMRGGRTRNAEEVICSACGYFYLTILDGEGCRVGDYTIRIVCIEPRRNEHFI